MKDIFVVIGSNFGDEGKGLMTDYFCNQDSANPEILNVRFNGGAQAGHTVVNSDGSRHVFSHFGAGSFNKKVSTYLAEDFIVNPILFRKEHQSLLEKGLNPDVYVHSGARITIPIDMMINQFVENFRGENRHGSCGVGILETVKRYERKPETADGMSNILNVYAILLDLMERLKELNIDTIKIEDLELAFNKNIKDKYMDDLIYFNNHVTRVNSFDELYDKFDNIIFEGAQGLLLDQNNLSYFPHLTPSNTGIFNVMKMLKGKKDFDLEICYVTRTYITRHGAGKFVTETDKENIASGLIDITNKTNEYQGALRYGYFDAELLRQSIETDLKNNLFPDCYVSIAFTHCNVTGDCVIEENGSRIITEVAEKELKDLVCYMYISRGLTSNEIVETTTN